MKKILAVTILAAGFAASTLTFASFPPTFNQINFQSHKLSNCISALPVNVKDKFSQALGEAQSVKKPLNYRPSQKQKLAQAEALVAACKNQSPEQVADAMFKMPTPLISIKVRIL